MSNEVLEVPKDKRTGWMRDLKPGDKVAVGYREGQGFDYRGLMTVTQVTPSGRIRCGDKEYDSDGRRRGERFRGYLLPFCEEARLAVQALREKEERARKRRDMVSKVTGIRWDDANAMTDARLEAICKLIDGEPLTVAGAVA